MTRSITPTARIATATFGIAIQQENLPSFAEVTGMALAQYQTEFGIITDPVRKQTVYMAIRYTIECLSKEHNVVFTKNTKSTGRPKKVSFKEGLRKAFAELV
jgi:hypothetical protein